MTLPKISYSENSIKNQFFRLIGRDRELSVARADIFIKKFCNNQVTRMTTPAICINIMKVTAVKEVLPQSDYDLKISVKMQLIPIVSGSPLPS
ncbi:hypothetical protein NPIL_625561 [Nephila pilipes]|uniref:Uncharacterized protein n=1 Tax=Nephila pilipes TaxID=299642 RepID=A0A8X6U594_NEPPI|nr:hypothetical protein NPIL_625561 [Nephila pilipes]